MELQNKNIMITGASGGMGKAIALALKDSEANLFLHFNDVQIDQNEFPKASLIKADFYSMVDIERMFNSIQNLDILINVVGIEKISENPFDLTTWQEIFNVNLFAAVRCSEEGIKRMGEAGLIINISSVVGKENVTFKSDSIAYPASKAGLNKLTEGIVALHSPRIRAVTISPGYTKTPMWDSSDEGTVKSALAEVPENRFVLPDEIAKTVLHIIDNDAINGTNIVVDGGLAIRRIF